MHVLAYQHFNECLVYSFVKFSGGTCVVALLVGDFMFSVDNYLLTFNHLTFMLCNQFKTKIPILKKGGWFDFCGVINLSLQKSD